MRARGGRARTPAAGDAQRAGPASGAANNFFWLYLILFLFKFLRAADDAQRAGPPPGAADGGEGRWPPRRLPAAASARCRRRQRRSDGRTFRGRRAERDDRHRPAVTSQPRDRKTPASGVQRAGNAARQEMPASGARPPCSRFLAAACETRAENPHPGRAGDRRLVPAPRVPAGNGAIRPGGRSRGSRLWPRASASASGVGWQLGVRGLDFFGGGGGVWGGAGGRGGAARITPMTVTCRPASAFSSRRARPPARARARTERARVQRSARTASCAHKRPLLLLFPAPLRPSAPPVHTCLVPPLSRSRHSPTLSLAQARPPARSRFDAHAQVNTCGPARPRLLPVPAPSCRRRTDA